MDTYTEHQLKSELETSSQCIADYKKLCQNQQATISELKNELFMVKNEMKYMDYTS